MRFSKRIMALAVALVMMLSFSITGSALTFSDVNASSKYEKAISSMVSLGLLKGYDDGTFRPDNTITRAEFAAVITRAIGMEQTVSGASSAAIFTDMKPNGTDHWATGYVKVAYDRGIIAGMGDGTFDPDSTVTYEQAVKMVVCALGYEVAAVDKGGWPNGYLAQAQELDMLQNATITPTNSPAPRGLVAQIVFNALEVRLMERATSGKMVTTTKTMLKDMLKVSSYTNMMVTEVDGAVSINAGNSNIKSGEMILESGADKAVYDYSGVFSSSDARSLLGHYVSGYYKISSDDEDKRVLIMANESSKNEEVTISAENIDSLSNLKLSYWIDKENDTRTETITISNAAKLLYNNVAYDYLGSNVAAERNLSYWLDPDSEGFINGEVRLLDSGADGTYDAIFIDDYKTFVVKSPVKTNDTTYNNNYIIYDYYTTGKSVRIDPYDRNITVSILNAKTNAEVKIENIKTMNILSVAESSDGKYYKCYVSTDALSGTIEGKSTDDKKYTINKNEYELTKEFRTAIADGKASMDVGSTGTFYLDKDGKIAAATITVAQTGNYMYITAAGKYDISGENAAVELIALSGSPSTPTKYKVSSKVRINNATYSDVDEILDTLERSAKLLDSNKNASDAKYSQLAKVVINSSKEVTSILTAATTNSGALDIGSNTITSTLKLGQANKEYLYSTSSGFESQVFANASTQVLVIPTARRDNTKYKRSTGTKYFNAGNRYTIEAYDMNNSANAKVILVFGDEADVSITSDTPASLVTSVSEIISETTGDRVFSITVYENGVQKTYEAENDSSDYALKAGDVVRFGFNSSGQVNNVDKQVNVANLVPAKKNGDIKDENGEYKFKSILGTVYSLSPERLIVSPAWVDTTGEIPTLSQDEREGYQVNSSVAVYKVNIGGSGDAKIEKANINDIVEFGETAVDANASVVYAYSLSSTLKMIVIYVK